MHIDRTRRPATCCPKIERMFELSAGKIRSLETTWPAEAGAPVFTVERPLSVARLDRMDPGLPVRLGDAAVRRHRRHRVPRAGPRRGRVERMAPHLTHVGVHDHGFNNVSTYGGLWRLAREGRIDAPPWELRFYELALKVSGAVQARRWTQRCRTAATSIRSTARTRCSSTPSARCARWRSAHMLGHGCRRSRTPRSTCSTGCSSTRARPREYAVYYGEGRDTYDVRGRTAHESLFNVANGTLSRPEQRSRAIRRSRPGPAGWPGR